MFSTTFLGHQGWLFQSGRSCILADPLLCEAFGAVHALEYRVYPPRRLDFAAFPAVDAVVLSHEHDDHFDVASLARLDRAIPIFLSSRSSAAAFGILRDMGFDVRPLRPGVAVDVGDLQVIPFSGDHVNVNNADEWDALPYLVRDRFGAGSFFTMVDVALLSTHVQWARAYAPRPGIVTWSNNSLDWSYMSNETARDVGTEQCLMRMGTDHKLIATEWGKPAAMLTCAGGFSFDSQRSWLNERVFWVDAAAVCAKLASMYRDERFIDTLPGQTLRMQHNRVISVDASTPFLRVAPRHEWPARTRRPFDAGDSDRDYAPACGRTDFEAGDDDRLQQSLTELARALVGGMLFRSLHSMLAIESGARKPTFALVLRHRAPDGARVYEYDASACAFVAVDEAQPRDAYIAGLECWATDMLAVLRGDMGPIALMFGRARMWNALPQRFFFDILEGLTRVSHPLVRPADYLRTYRRLLAAERDARPTVRANVAAASAPPADAPAAPARSAGR